MKQICTIGPRTTPIQVVLAARSLQWRRCSHLSDRVTRWGALVRVHWTRCSRCSLCNKFFWRQSTILAATCAYGHTWLPSDTSTLECVFRIVPGMANLG